MIQYNEEEFFEKIFQATGKKLGDFGFINGTASPFQKEGMISAAEYKGFMIWKNEIDGSFTDVHIDKPVKDTLELTIDFLTDTNKFYAKSRTGYYDK